MQLYFSENQLREISQWFDDVSISHNDSNDKENIQVITVEEIMKFLSLKRYHSRNFHHPTLMEVMKEIERIKPRSQKILTKQEFINMFSKWIKLPNIRHELNLAFSLFDTEKRNFLDIDELQVIVTQYGDAFTEDEVRELLRDANVRGDGNVFYRNFMKSLFAVAPELMNLKIGYLYNDATEDPSTLLKPVVGMESRRKSAKKKKPQKSRKKKVFNF
ncbi:calmodulin-like [Aricia agestis]|uniref:calmodulin-like n=1 Tax=Aricia agestis TaxID=91739 RepID=UPI001C203702|nr:calmodulin-like [Aricia agestis]